MPTRTSGSNRRNPPTKTKTQGPGAQKEKEMKKAKALSIILSHPGFSPEDRVQAATEILDDDQDKLVLMVLTHPDFSPEERVEEATKLVDTQTPTNGAAGSAPASAQKTPRARNGKTKAEEVLKVVADLGGEANVTEIREALGLEATNQKNLLYNRLSALVKSGKLSRVSNGVYREKPKPEEIPSNPVVQIAQDPRPCIESGDLL